MAARWWKQIGSLRARLPVLSLPIEALRARLPVLSLPIEALRARLPVVSLRRAAVAGLMIAVGVAAAQGLRHRGMAIEVVREHPYFKVGRIEIRGVGALVSEAEVRGWLGIHEGASLWDAAPDTIEDRLEAHPMVRSATVRRRFPDNLEIRVRERRPAAIAVLDELYYIDRNGQIFGPLATHHDHDYPVFTGVSAVDGQRRWALRRALQLLRRSESREGKLEISELHLDPEDGLVLYPTEVRVPVYLGWSGWEPRLRRAQRVLATWQGAIDQLARLDLRFRDQVVLSLREPRPLRLGGGQDGQVST